MDLAVYEVLVGAFISAGQRHNATARVIVEIGTADACLDVPELATVEWVVADGLPGDALVAAVTAEGGVNPARAEAITRAVLAALRDAVPEEVADVTASMPTELRGLWAQPTAAAS